ncbi:MAG: alpha-2-macroglobulin family protein [Bacteroidetes bacterium]|nr:MAG: alpha-2-macroglobulin family protein [Bacteroidota bacterium]
MIRQFFLLLAVATSITACKQNSVRLTFTNAKDEVVQLGNLNFRFSKNLVPDSLLNSWDSTNYISFEPAIAGRFRWIHADELVFSPAGPMAPATSYKASLNKALLKHSAYNAVDDGGGIAFKTPDLALESTNWVWVLPSGQSSPAAQVDLYFNYAVAPQALKEKFDIEIEGKTVDYTLQTVSSSTKMSVLLSGLKVEDKDYSMKLLLQKGIVPEGGKNGLPEEKTIESVIASPFTLRINDVSSEHDGTNGTVYVKTSQQLVAGKLEQLIGIDPKIAYSTELTEDGFKITSAQFDVNNSYALVLRTGLRGVIGGTLKEDYSSSVAFGELEPSLSFGSEKGVFLSGKGAKNLEVKITGIAKVKVTISKIYENNLLNAARNGYYPNGNDENYDEEDGYYNSNDRDFGAAGDVIYQKEIDVRSLPKFGNGRLFNFNLADRLAEFKGIYHIQIRSSEDYWISESRFISVSDIGLIAKEGSQKILVFANSINTAKPLAGVGLSVYGGNNQLLGTGSTNGEGVAEIAYIRKDFSGFKPAMVIANTAQDFNYLPFESTKVNMSRFDVGGKRINPTGLDAFVYPERDIYRPGEQLNFAVVVRDLQFKVPGALPIKIKLLMPNGKELAAFRKTLDEQGTTDGAIPLSVAAITGTYLLEVYNGNDVLLATQNFKVEEFMPDRLKVLAKLDNDVLQPGNTATLNITAANYFGPPAAGRKYECDIQVKAKTFSPKGFGRYNFALANQTSFFDNVLKQGTTNAAGVATEGFAVPETYKNIGLLQARFFATVFDETGRPVSRNAMAKIYTQPVFFGVGASGNNYFPLNQPVAFPLVAVNTKEQAVTAKATIQIIKHEYRTILAKSGTQFRYESQQEDKLLQSQQLSVSGTGTQFTYIPRSPGNYELRVSLPGATAYVSQSFYSYGSWGAESNSFAVNTEGEVDIDLDKEKYNKGDNVKALFKAPFNGRMLVTVETDKVLSYQYVDVVNRAASIDLKLDESHLPNAYITATVFKPHEVSDVPLTVAHGYKNINVEDKDKQLAVSITAETKVRSKTKQKITISAAPNAMVTLAAVDDGVLAISNFKTPDPYNHFYAQRALGVNGFDIYPLLFPELRARLSSTGGDADLEMNQRQNPMPSKRVKLLSYWSGMQKANSSGKAIFEVDIPQFSGQVRLMAVSVKDNRFGSAVASMTVADPIVISAALPRFMSPGDTVLMPVTISNTTGKPTLANATVKTSGPFQVVDAPAQGTTVAANGEAVAVFKIVAGNSIGMGKVAVQVNGLGETFTHETEMSVRPPSTLQKVSGSGSIAANATQRVNMNTSDFIPTTLSYHLVVGRSPALQLGSQLQYLVNYPYGCTEQTISAAFPQLYYADMSEFMKTGAALQKASVENVQLAINKIKMRQLYNGAVALWDNETSENWWCTAYAAHFLIEAQKLGYGFDKSLLQTMLNYLSFRLRNRAFVNYTYNRTQVKKIAPKEVAYSLYVLALAGRPNASAMNYYKAAQKDLALDSRYLLSAAFALAGDKQSFKALLPNSFGGEEAVATFGSSFYSDIRDESVALNALLDIDPNNAQVPVMARHIADKLKARTWYSTQESAFGFLALGKLSKAANASTATATVAVNGKTVGSMTGSPMRLTAAQLSGTVADIKAQGNGAVYYWWQSQGISATGSYKEEDSYLKIRRQFYDRFGRQISGNAFKQNDLIVVQLTLDKAYSGTIENIVVTDILPAGFEIENPRIKDLPGMEWVKDATTPEQMDVRDDRIHLFTNLGSNRQVFYYTVRAVSPGVFKMGPASADAMYNGEYHSYHGGGLVRVVQ